MHRHGAPRRTAAGPGRTTPRPVPRGAAPLLAAGLLLGVPLLGGCTSASGGDPEPAPTSPASPSSSGGTSTTAASAPATAPPRQPPAELTEGQVNAAVARIDGYAQNALAKTGVPGLALAVVYKDKVIHAKGLGVRQLGKPEAVDPDTVFQLASVSKPIASTVVAGVVGQKVVEWDDPVTAHDPGFALADPWVSGHVTIADLFAHRSGLPDHAGDLLEDLGYQRDYILQHLREHQLAPFRASYAYTNYGLTEAAAAVAKAKGVAWEDLAADVLYKPLGMNSTSSLRSAYDSAANKATPHVRDAAGWQVSTTENPDPQAPAGGVSSTVQDLGRWMRLQLADGTFEGKQIVDPAGLNETRLPQTVSSPTTAPAGRTGFYGLGWNVSYDPEGRLRLNHSGAFSLGAATVVTLLPSEQLGIVVLTNGQPSGVPEAVAEEFFDLAQYGHETVDWLGFMGKVVPAAAQSPASPTDYATPPAGAAPAKPDSAYLGTYGNDYFGPMTVSSGDGGGLVMSLGPDNLRFPLQHYDGDVFSFRTRGENAAGLSGVTFAVGADGKAATVVVEQFDHDGLGTFTRS
ncbi:serine hydrolase [Kitasatospora purpeofusca]|uniref:Serine hydrolase n=1 Tax=Kitasatospora purpeofusca TaxID=67352 RepID=A0ABZ1UAC6_9ACTN|nr:serine hydrolase [Kitasatospora purpeofusca]